MRIFVTVKTNAKEEKVTSLDQTHFVVSVKAVPVEGKANRAVVKVLAKHLGCAPTCLVLKSGATSKRKVFELSETCL
jgi:uncharacterized protein YggU (UPF0235/DUF167 family)